MEKRKPMPWETVERSKSPEWWGKNSFPFQPNRRPQHSFMLKKSLFRHVGKRLSGR